ncbi:MAG: DEAD/DEAH box helicase family protein [Methylococcales bacterium]|nr:DEAD/DEAH box helicase family protein [Methylococcales bacterium]
MTDDRPESIFQRHLIDYLKAQHGYTLLDAEDISDKEFYIAEAFLLAFIKATQAETLARLQVNYGSDSSDEILKALKAALIVRPLWLIIRNGLTVQGEHFQLFFPKPRSSESISNQHWLQNRIQLKSELVIKDVKRPDVVVFLNGLPIVVIELKHEKNQTVHDAVKQFNDRNHDDQIFRLPFLYVAMDTADIKVATDPRLETNFRWYNAGLSNTPQTEGEYPVEFFYREVLAKENLLKALSFYLVYVPEKNGKPAYTVFPRYHQSRLVDSLCADICSQFAVTGQVGKKYLVNHSAGSGKTLTLSWLAERLHSLYKAETSIKLLDIVFILTDRNNLDKNVRDELDCFLHLDTQMAYANKSSQLKTLIHQRKPIIVTTIQKFQRIFDVLRTDASLVGLRVAFLIDEAHRSQEGKNARAIRQPFQAGSQALIEQAVDSLDEIKKVLQVHAPNQLFVAFTATPTAATVKLFGEPFDTYSEAEAIAEGYIVDVAAQIISYQTVYNLHLPFVPNAKEEQLYPKGIISKLLKQVAFEDDGLIQYKAEVMLRAFEEQVKPLVDGKAKAMIVTSSRIAGLKYYQLLTAKIAEKQQAYPGQYNYKVLYAFSDFTHRLTHEDISEHKLNGLNANERIEERFKQDDYRIMVVASKFQTGFDEPLLAGMFLDKPVMDKNAVQTVSRLNRCYEGKSKVIVIDFTNNTANILKAFNKYRKGTPYEATPPDQQKVITLYQGIIGRGLFTDVDASDFMVLLTQGQDAVIQSAVNRYRQRFLFQYDNLPERKAYVYELAKLVKAFNFLSSFYHYEEAIGQFVLFAEFIQPQLIKEGAISELMQAIGNVKLVKANVVYKGVTGNKPAEIKEPRRGGAYTCRFLIKSMTRQCVEVN